MSARAAHAIRSEAVMITKDFAYQASGAAVIVLAPDQRADLLNVVPGAPTKG